MAKQWDVVGGLVPSWNCGKRVVSVAIATSDSLITRDAYQHSPETS